MSDLTTCGQHNYLFSHPADTPQFRDGTYMDPLVSYSDDFGRARELRYSCYHEQNPSEEAKLFANNNHDMKIFQSDGEYDGYSTHHAALLSRTLNHQQALSQNHRLGGTPHYEWTQKIGPNSKLRRPDGRPSRTTYTAKQRLELEKEFRLSKFVTKQRRSELAIDLQLSERQVKIWFQNQRMKEKRDNIKIAEMNSAEKGKSSVSSKRNSTSISSSSNNKTTKNPTNEENKT